MDDLGERSPSGGRATLFSDTKTDGIADNAELSLDELEAELATLASHLYAGSCRWLELVAELDRRGGWAESGRASCAEWLAWRCALTPRAAREHVRVARRLGELPLIHAGFARGELSYAKVRALTKTRASSSSSSSFSVVATRSLPPSSSERRGRIVVSRRRRRASSRRTHT
jgi:hypothetical protein